MHRSIVPSTALLLALAGALPAYADAPKPIDGSHKPTTLAVIGDTPYGAQQVVDLPNLIASINADPEVDRVVHVGDIKNGSTRCDTSYYEQIEQSFASFSDSLVYTPGDNEWTDCHRASNGKYDPLERLEALREVFFSDPGYTLGGSAERVFTQADSEAFAELPENVAWVRSRVVFSTLHVVGSRNGLAPWFADDTTDGLADDPARRTAEVALRTSAALAWLDRTFELADKQKIEGVVIFMQADTWPGSASDGFASIVQRLAQRSLSFGKPVLVVQGDSHRYLVDQPLLTGDAVHGVNEAVPNLSRLVVEGETTGEWLKLHVDPRSDALFSWERIAR
jgi:hypothetical protein